MNKRILGFLCAVALVIAPVVAMLWMQHTPIARAQNAPNGLTMGTTVTANIYGGQNYFYLLISGGNVTTFNLVNQNAAGTAAITNPQVVTIVFQQDGTGTRTVGFGTMFATATIPVVFATANKFTVMQFYYDTASALWYQLSTAAVHN